MSTVLVVGSTGVLGREVVGRLRAAGAAVRALVRPGRDNEVTQAFESSGVGIVRGDLKSPSSLDVACRQVDVVVSTATSTSSRLEGDSIESVDALGHLALIDAAETAGVSHFIHVSFAPLDAEFELQRAKQRVEDRLRASQSLEHTILRPVYYMETWLPGFAPTAADTPVAVLGTGEGPVNWISLNDVARCIAAAVGTPAARNTTIELGGPEPLSQLNVLELFHALGAPKPPIVRVSEDELRDEFERSTDPLLQAYGALKLGIARGHVVHGNAPRELALENMVTVRDFVGEMLQAQHSTA